MHINKRPIITFVIVTLMAWNGLACGKDFDRPTFGEPQLNKMQTKLDLTDEQTEALKALFAQAKQERQEILKRHGLKQRDLQAMHQERQHARQDDRQKLSMILNGKQMQLLEQTMRTRDPEQLQQATPEQRLVQLQNSLGLTLDEAKRVAAVLKEGHTHRQQALAKHHLSPKQMLGLHGDMQAQQKKMDDRLNKVLKPKQMAKFAELRKQNRPANRPPSFGRKGEEL